MPTISKDRKPYTTLPDIFRTVDGTDLDIGMQDRMRDADGKGSSVPWGRGRAREPEVAAPARYPRIVLRDSLGYELDTFTTLQEAIYRAKWKVKQTGQAQTPLEWRLPKAPPPARPDLTRSFPPLKHPRVETELDKLKKRLPYSNVLEFDVDDVGFVRESLQYLPYVPSLSFLRQEILCGPKMYFQIVGTMLMHERILSLTEKRNAVYNFPGFCSGCIRLGLCYGCSKSSAPHYHEDKPVKTGGGFTYFKKDRPENEIKSKNPINWKIKNPDQALKQLMEEYGGVDLEGKIPEEIKKHLDAHGGHRERHLSHIPDFASEMKEQNMAQSGDAGHDRGFLPDIVASHDLESDHDDHTHDDTHGDLSSTDNQSRSHVRFTGQRSGHSDVDLDLYDDTEGQGQTESEEEDDLEDQGHLSSRGNDHRQKNFKRRTRSEEVNRRKDVIDIDVGKRGSSYGREDRRYSKHRKVESDNDGADEEEDSDDERNSARKSRSRNKLYKPPPPFKLKKSPSRKIASKSPFSSDRKYDLPTGGSFQVAKSDKAPTKFKAFRNVDVSWKEPKKFELKDNAAKPTKFWSGPRKRKDDDGGSKRKTRRVSPHGRGRSSPVQRSLSPDSGLDSEFMTVIVRKKSSTRSRRNSRRISPVVLSTGGEESSSPALSVYTPLDGYTDTAAEYYKNRDVLGHKPPEEGFRQGRSPLYGRGGGSRGLPPLRGYKEDSESDDNWKQTAREVERRYMEYPQDEEDSDKHSNGDEDNHGNPNTKQKQPGHAKYKDQSRPLMKGQKLSTRSQKVRGETNHETSRQHDRLSSGQPNISREEGGQLSREPTNQLSREPINHLSRESRGHLLREPTGHLSREHTDLLSKEYRGHLSREPTNHMSREQNGQLSREPTVHLSRERTGHLSSSKSHPNGSRPNRDRLLPARESSSNNILSREATSGLGSQERMKPEERRHYPDYRQHHRYVDVDNSTDDEESDSDDNGTFYNDANYQSSRRSNREQNPDTYQKIEKPKHKLNRQYISHDNNDDTEDQQFRRVQRNNRTNPPGARPNSACSDVSDFAGNGGISKQNDGLRDSTWERENTYTTDISVKVTKNDKKAQHQDPVRYDNRSHRHQKQYKKETREDEHEPINEEICENEGNIVRRAQVGKKNINTGRDVTDDLVPKAQYEGASKYTVPQAHYEEASKYTVPQAQYEEAGECTNDSDDALQEEYLQMYEDALNAVKTRNDTDEHIAHSEAKSKQYRDSNERHEKMVIYKQTVPTRPNTSNKDGESSHEDLKSFVRFLKNKDSETKENNFEDEHSEDLQKKMYQHVYDLGRNATDSEEMYNTTLYQKGNKKQIKQRRDRRESAQKGELGIESDNYNRGQDNDNQSNDEEETAHGDIRKRRHRRRHHRKHGDSRHNTEHAASHMDPSVANDDIEFEDNRENHDGKFASDNYPDHKTNPKDHMHKHKRRLKAELSKENDTPECDITDKEGIEDTERNDDYIKQKSHRHRTRQTHRRREHSNEGPLDEDNNRQFSQLTEDEHEPENSSNTKQMKDLGKRVRKDGHKSQSRKKREHIMENIAYESDDKSRERTRSNTRDEVNFNDNTPKHSLKESENRHLMSSKRNKRKHKRKHPSVSREQTDLVSDANEGVTASGKEHATDNHRSAGSLRNKLSRRSKKKTGRPLEQEQLDIEDKTNSVYQDTDTSHSDSSASENTDDMEYEGKGLQGNDRSTVQNNGNILSKNDKSGKGQINSNEETKKENSLQHLKMDPARHPFSPPAIPSNIDFEKCSLTSHEPDLELVFDDVLDVENLEVVDDEEDEEEKKRAHDKRKRRRHRRRKRREAEKAKEAEDVPDQMNSENELKNSSEHKPGYETEKSSLVLRDSDGDMIGQAVELVAKENTPLDFALSRVKQKSLKEDSEDIGSDEDSDQPDTQGRQTRTSRRSKDGRRKNASTERKSNRKQSDDRSQGRRKSKQSKERHSRDRGSQDRFSKDRSSLDRKSKEKQTRNTKKVKEGEKSKLSKTAPDNEKEKKVKKKKKSIKEVENDEPEFQSLPSIQTQLFKIMGAVDSRRFSNNKNIHNEHADEELDEARNEIKEYVKNMPSEQKWECVRPKSDELGVVDDSNMDRSNMQIGRSQSMPSLTDIEILMKQMGEDSLEKLKQPLFVPMYLPSFRPQPIIKKQFNPNPKRVLGRDRSQSVFMPTGWMPFMDFEDSTVKSELETLKEETLIIPTPSPEPEPVKEPQPPVMDEARTPTPLSLQVPSSEKAKDEPAPPKRREIVKKEKKVKPPPPKPPTPVREPTPSPSPQPSEEEPAVTSRDISFVYDREPVVPQLPPIEIPALPDILEKQPSQSHKVKKEMKLIEVAPELPEAKKKLPPPPKLAPRIRGHGPLRRSKVAEAPVTSQELQQLSDPLDFLAKYCIINPDRLPFYERVFNGAVDVQTPRYSKDEGPRPGAMVRLPPAVLSEHELNMLRDLTVLNHAQSPRREGISAPEQYLEKLNYTVEFIRGKSDTIQDHMQKLQGEKIHLLATLAKEMDRDIAKLDYKVVGQKKKKKKKKKKVDIVDYDQEGVMSGSQKDFKPTRMSDITDEVIVSRMNDKMMKKVKKDPVVRTLGLEISRDIEKLKHYDQRIAQIEDEKDLVGLYCMDYYFSEQAASSRPHEFRRQQSRLYQKLHPNPDIEMNTEEVEAALQQINNKLLTEKEFQYIYFILDLPKREKINFRLFSIIAALSEKVTQLDPVIRKLINKNDYNALDVKMEKSKELFDLLQDAEIMPMGNAPADNLAVELTAGGLTPEHTNYVLSKFDRDGRGFCDFLDFVTYVPLFVQIHKRIIDDPFNDRLDI